MQGRGLNFLVGCTVLFFGWRLYQAGVFHDVGLLSISQPPTRGPGAVLVSFVVEAVIAVGTLSTLLVSGLWDLAVFASRLVGDAINSGSGYLRSLTPGAPSAPKSKQSPPPSPLPVSDVDVIRQILRDHQQTFKGVAADLKSLQSTVTELAASRTSTRRKSSRSSS